MSENIKISMIGPSGSGKTMVLSAFHQAFISGCVSGDNGAVVSVTGSQDDPAFRGDDPKGFLSGIYTSQIMASYAQSRLMATQGKDGRVKAAAAGTVEMTNFNFDLDVSTAAGQELSQSIKLTDYRGGILSLDRKSATELDDLEVRAFMDNLSKSEIIFILLDGIKLAQYRSNDSLRKEKTGADRINPLMNSLMSNPGKGVNVIVLVTKVDCDVIPADLRENNYQRLCELACSTLDTVYAKSTNLTRHHGWTFSVVPVTAIGENTSLTNYVKDIDEYVCLIKNGADIKQKNIDSAIIYSIRNTLSYRSSMLAKLLRDCEAKLNAEYKQFGIFNVRQRKAVIEELEKKKSELSKERDKYQLMLNAMNEGFASRFGAIKRFGVS